MGLRPARPGKVKEAALEAGRLRGRSRGRAREVPHSRAAPCEGAPEPVRHGPGEERGQAGRAEEGREAAAPADGGSVNRSSERVRERDGACGPLPAAGALACRSGRPVLGLPGSGRCRGGGKGRGPWGLRRATGTAAGIPPRRRRGRPARVRRRAPERPPADQKPALIFSNSSSIRSRIAGSSGVWESSVVSTGSRSAFFSASGVISAMAASFVSA